MTWDALCTAATARHLTVLGGFHPTQQDKAPTGCQTLVLLGPDEPGFWPMFVQSSEMQDGLPDPTDRWSTRVITEMAGELEAQPLFPFGGPPFLPFFSWATRTGRIHASPVNFLVHDHAGLFVSFRGALAFGTHLDVPAPPPSPCLTCADQPCLTACPVQALSPSGYDVPACKVYLDTPEGDSCMAQGCQVRRICPVSKGYARLPEQSAYHMRHFNRGS